MKAWEILKALDEGKTIERSMAGLGWETIAKDRVGGFLVENLERYTYRIKPDPRAYYLVLEESGYLYGAYSTKELADR